ncbi:MAG: hypothetical protein HRU19_29705 [Pseudobacteriovorax sp.]|nr:hypothetical protein [Pseudobacteriovorax sp.]
MRVLAFIFISCLVSSMGFSGSETGDSHQKVDSILDRLERKLLESRQDSLLLDQSWQDQKKKRLKPARSLKFSGEKISSMTPSQQDFIEIEGVLDSIDMEVKQLSSDLEKIKQVVAKDKKHNSDVTMQISIKNPEKTIVRELTVTIDDYEVYRVDEAVGLWVPRKTFPIFTGPMLVGRHNIRINGRIVKAVSDQVPIDDNVYQLINQDYNLVIPETPSKKLITIEIDDIGKQNFKAEARIIAQDI